MGRRRKNAVYGFFSYEKSTDQSKCVITGCETTVKGQHGTNLMYHLANKHPDEHMIVVRRNEMMDESEKENNDNNASTSNTSTGSICSKKKNIQLLQQECVNLVTVHGRPFAMIDDLAFRAILSFTTFNKRELQTINTHSIRSKVKVAAQVTREIIAKEIKNKLISIKIDNATCRDRLFMGINLQYLSNGEIVIKNLGVVELHARSTSDFLKEKVLYVLRKYQIRVDQIYSITTDNGANMLKLVRLLNELLVVDYDSDDEAEDDTDAIEDIVITLELESDTSSDSASPSPLVPSPHNITSIKCAAHTLQLAVLDAVKEEDFMSVIDKARSVVRRLRTPTIKNVLKAAKKKKPVLDSPTRWHSTLDMLESLSEVREYCSNSEGDPLYLSESTWATLQGMIASLTPSKILTKTLQSEQLTLGDFYHLWLKCHMDTEKILLPLAQYICSHMETRKTALMENSTFVSALYLDPRFQVVLSPEEICRAKDHIRATWLQILKIELRAKGHQEQLFQQDNKDQEEEEDEVEKILAATEREKRCYRRSTYIQSYSNIAGMLDNFQCHPRLHHKENVLRFWEQKKKTDPQLYSIASIILATPATQVSVERLFSSLKFVLSALRTNLTDDIVEDILVVRNNK